MPPVSPRTVIVVDDDPSVNASLKLALVKLGFDAVACANGKEYFAAIETIDADAVLMDVHLGDTTGIQLLEETRRRGISTPVVMITGYGDVQIAVRSMKAGAEDFILKPITLDQLEITLQKALRVRGLAQEVERLRVQLSESETSKKILGASPAIREAILLAEKFAESRDTTVLLQGDSGTGKELFAHYIHSHSARADQPFVIVDCAAIPKDLAENELFGYERGAFTGATEKLKKGRFDLAQHGTIFLDEIGDLPPGLQAKLLRAIESKTFYRLGGTQEIKADVRVIAATNSDLASAAAKGEFREDLYYRLNVAHIAIPALRERKEDIPLIAATLIEEFNAKFRKHVAGISPEAAQILQNYRWPGNVRELRNVIERCMLVNTGDTILPEHLGGLRIANANGAANEYSLALPSEGVTMDSVMRDLMRKTLAMTEGNQVQAARILGISRAKLRHQIEQLGLRELQKQNW